jgi:hypothetical protein
LVGFAVAVLELSVSAFGTAIDISFREIYRSLWLDNLTIRTAISRASNNGESLDERLWQDSTRAAAADIKSHLDAKKIEDELIGVASVWAFRLLEVIAIFAANMALPWTIVWAIRTYL